MTFISFHFKAFETKKKQTEEVKLSRHDIQNVAEILLKVALKHQKSKINHRTNSVTLCMYSTLQVYQRSYSQVGHIPPKMFDPLQSLVFHVLFSG
jgi:hypothetical protein